LKVQDGCDYSCSFCTIPLARGASRSDSIANIVETAREIAQTEVREIVLTGVNTGDYGYMVWHTAFVDALNALSVSWQSEGQWQINSQYRNPVHQQLHLGGATNSKHQYGCAADLQTYPVNPTNSVDSASAWDFWHRLAELARSQSFVVEDSLASGIGHVHVQEFC